VNIISIICIDLRHFLSGLSLIRLEALILKSLIFLAKLIIKENNLVRLYDACLDRRLVASSPRRLVASSLAVAVLTFII
jgi:hypothetical protein